MVTHYTVGRVCEIVTDDDVEFTFSGSDDDFDAEEIEGSCDERDDDMSVTCNEMIDECTIETMIEDRDDEGSNINDTNGSDSDASVELERAEIKGNGMMNRRGSCVSNRGRGMSSRGRGSQEQGGSNVTRGRGRGRGRSRGRGRGRGRCGSGRGNDRYEDRVWTDIESDIGVDEFKEKVGPNCTVSSKPIDIFLSLFSMMTLDIIVQETNRYARQCMGPDTSWQTNREEILAYIGFCTLMGINKLPDMYDYWSTNEYLHYLPIASKISRKRFLSIKGYLHFTDNDKLIERGQPGFDRLGRIRPIIDSVHSTLKDIYMPHKEVSVDEAMIKFKGRSSLKQYMPKKPIKRGIKVWVRADAINGFVSDFDIYIGKEETTVTQLGTKVVLKLCNYLPRGHHIYFDNYFSSLDLLDKLLEKGLYACGTFRKDRVGIPNAITKAQLGMTPHI